MKRIFVIAAIVSLLMLAACSRPYDLEISPDSDENEVILEPGGSVLYVVNTEARSYHLPSCYQTDRIKDENKVETRHQFSNEPFLHTLQNMHWEITPSPTLRLGDT